MASLSCTVEDYKRQTATVRVTVPAASATPANAKKLADFIKGQSDARVVGYGVALDYTGDSCDSGDYDRVLHTLTLLYEDQDGKARRFSIPAPSDESLNDDQEPESDLAEDVADLLKAIGAIKSVTYNGGGLKSRLPSKEARSKARTGV